MWQGKEKGGGKEENREIVKHSSCAPEKWGKICGALHMPLKNLKK